MLRFFKRLLKKFPIREYDKNGNLKYYEHNDGYWSKSQYSKKGEEIFWENSDGYWEIMEHDANGKQTYSKNSIGSTWGVKNDYDRSKI